MRKPKSVLVVYERQTFRGNPCGYKLLQVNIKTSGRENIMLFSNGNVKSIPNPYFSSISGMQFAVIQLLKNNNFIPHYWDEGGANLFDIDFLDISQPNELKRYYF